MLCLQWTVLNATRPQEARELEWDWINTEDQIVVIPGSDMKSGREHRIPYSTVAAELLDKMQTVRNGKFVFPSKYNKPYGRDVFPKLARQVMPGIDITAHGFRATFTEWASELTIFEDEMVDIQLAHHIGNKVARAYRRGDRLRKRRDMMNAWAAYCQTGEIDEQYRSTYRRSKLAAAAD
jgi:integrase